MTTPIDYSARDYEVVREALLSRIQDHLPEWKSRSPNDFGIVMLELFAYSTDLLNYYADRIANEGFISTAVLESSVLDIARMVGYHPRAVQSATGMVNFTIAGDRAEATTIPDGTLLRTVSDDSRLSIHFSVVGSHVATAGLTALNEIPVIEGQVFVNELLGAGNGGPGQTVVIPYPDLDTDSLSVTVGTFEWTQAVSLINGTPTGRYYTVNMIPDGSWVVLFGDGVNGAMPAPGEMIRVSGRRSRGTEGNVVTGAINQMVTSIIGVLAVTNPQPTSGGESRETVEQIRTTLPQSLHSFDRAVTLPDYTTLANLYPGIAKSQATAVVYTNVTVYIVAIGGSGMPTVELRTALQAYLTERSLVNVTVAVDPPIFVEINVSVDVHRSPDTNDDQIAETIEATLQQAIDWTNPDINFNMVLTLSYIYKTIDDVFDVDYSIVRAFYKDGDAVTLQQAITMDIGEFPVIKSVVVNFI